jgi:hypothetical protein
MSTQIVAQASPAVAPTQLNDVEYACEFVAGKDLWAKGRPLAACVGSAEREGWAAADAAGAAAYFAAMCEQADAGEDVDWEGVNEVYLNAYGDRVW